MGRSSQYITLFIMGMYVLRSVLSGELCHRDEERLLEFNKEGAATSTG